MSYNPGFVIQTEYVRDHVIVDPNTKEKHFVTTHVGWGVGVDNYGYAIMGSPYQAFQDNEDGITGNKVFIKQEKVPFGDVGKGLNDYPIGGLHHVSTGI